ncbi:MAG TPA: tetratricopeptide repeat protein [Gemmataceae bacterium]
MTDSNPEPVVPAPEPPRAGDRPDRPARRRWPSVLIGVALFVVPAAVVSVVVLGRWDRNRALELFRQGDFAAAEALLKAAAERDPDDAEVAEALARGYVEAGDAAKALPFLTRWCELRPDQVEAADLRFRAALRLDRPEEAIAAGRHLLELDPANGAARAELARLYLSLGRYDEAERECRHRLRDAPDDPAALLLLAKVCQEKGDRAEAEKIVGKLLAGGVRSGEVLMLRAMLYLDADRPEEAVPLLRELAEGWPGQERFALYQLVVALKRAGRDEEAARAEERLHRLQALRVLVLDSNANPHNLPLRARAAEALFEAGRDRDAVALLRDALERDPNFAPAHRLLVGWHEKHGRPAEAARHRRLAGDAP